ncbi:glycerol-3-phosphate 1-O-acyltransferase PlsY [Rhodobium gokarnense]|uniref:Glycerol-3-phosphate acyltransferase n=1 Tax=Rhodobium gokarnense TaxID=364296 RepID=A0ABT3HA98_9HYPH|nr:glycerol-3-phosphate 1-O-acyltransferase PlsY [Rhodobium gokarnense]MCW2307279.1 glycerol-3-phosphate acyltransferase PlsY [Rhodobium gokarnense]
MTDILSWSLPWPHMAIALLFGYLLGSIPFGLLFTRLFGLGDIRSIGSGNIGATNVLRTGNKGVAALTLLGDVLKGTVPVVVAADWSFEAALIAGLGAFLGHLYPVWLGFKGGKGIATFIGVLLGLSWPIAVAFCAIWLVVALITRFSSLSALVASALTPVVALGFNQPKLAVFTVLLALLAWFKHRTNIARLVSGTEPKIGARS